MKRKYTESQKFEIFYKAVKIVIAAFFILSFLAVLSLRWLNPPTSSFMMQRKLEAWWNDEENFEFRHEWVDYNKISSYIKMAVITAEDQNFAYHRGFAIEQIEKVINDYSNSKGLRGASTITQQTAKNLFLYPAKNFFRKGLEAWFTILMESLLSKKRILELYLNIAAFGDGIYGVKAATAKYFNTIPADLSKTQSALMATSLPDPDRYNLAAPSYYMLNRRNWILQYMLYLGGQSYLKQL